MRMVYYYDEFLKKYEVPVTPKEYAVVFDAIPQGALRLLKDCSKDTTCNTNIGQWRDGIFLGDIDILNKRCSNKDIRNIIVGNTTPPSQHVWVSLYGSVNWKKAWNVTNTYCLTNKIKEVTFKILHRIYPAKHVLERFKLNIDFSCVFCGLHKETIIHLFFECMYCKIFWIDVQNYLSRKIGQLIILNAKDVCIYFDRKIDRDVKFVIQLYILIGKYHLHKMKWADKKTNFYTFLADMNLYISTINSIQNKKAGKTMYILEKYNLTPGSS